MKNVGLIFILLFPFQILFAQTVRIEIEAKSISDQFNIIPLKEQGILLFYEDNKQSEQARTEKWYFSRYDTTFTELWSVEYPMLNNLTYANYCLEGEFMYALFVKSKEFEIVKVHIPTGQIELTKGKIQYSDYKIYDFKVIGEYAFIGGTAMPEDNSVFVRSILAYIFFPLAFIPNFIPGREAMLIHTQLESKVIRNIPFSYKGTSSVSSLSIDTINQKINILTQNVSGRNTSIYIQDFMFAGLRNKSLLVKPFTKNYQLQTGKLTNVDGKEKILLGTYVRNNGTGAQGIYFTKFVDGKQDFIQYHSFTTLKNFFEYLDPHEKERIKKKIEKKQKRGKDLSLNYQLLVHDLMTDSNQYILVAEAYYPQYHTEYRTIWIYGRPMEQSYDVFDGWRYTHAIIVAFDKKGKLLWDNWFPINNTLSYNLNEKIKAIKKRDKNILAYNNSGTIHYKIIQNDTIIEHKTTFNAANGEDRDLAQTREVLSDIDYWYGKYFVAHGFEISKSRDNDYVQKDKIVFYINKFEINQDF